VRATTEDRGMTTRHITVQNPRVTAEFIDNLRDSDVVTCCFDDGDHIIAKGTELLEEAIRTNQAVERFLLVPVTNIEEAEVIAAAIRLIDAGRMHEGAIVRFAQMLAETGETRH
jgi:hypothetical protein